MISDKATYKSFPTKSKKLTEFSTDVYATGMFLFLLDIPGTTLSRAL